MHICSCLVAIGGDLSNKVYRARVTVPEIQVLQFIHGQGSVTEIKLLGNERIDQMGERDRLQNQYPKHARTVVGLWRDNGKFLADVRKLGLSAQQFAAKRTAPYDDADEMEATARKAAKKAAPKATAKKPAATKAEVQAPEPEPEPDEGAEEEVEEAGGVL